MEISKAKNGSVMEISLTGRLDTNTAPQLEASVREDAAEITGLEFDFSNLDYISSAGLRVLLATQKTMNKQGYMKIKNVKPEIMEVFDITGFSDILTIE